MLGGVILPVSEFHTTFHSTHDTFLFSAPTCFQRLQANLNKTVLSFWFIFSVCILCMFVCLFVLNCY